MKKILILANSAKGLYNFRKELLERLINDKYEIFVSVPDEMMVKELKDMNCNIITTSVDRRGINPFKDIRLFFSYMKILKRIKPDIVLTYTIKPNIYGSLACRIKKVKQIANITGLGTAFESGGLMQKILIFMYRIAMKKTKCVFFQNESNRDIFIKNKIVKDNIRLIPGSGVNLKKHSLVEYPKTDKIKFLFIGRIMKAKGIEEYLEAARVIKEKYENVEFTILGNIEQQIYKEKIDEYSNKNIVKYEGFQKDVRKYIIESNCVVLPSHCGEGMANVLLEGAATGRPLITTNIHGCKEAIDDGKNGYIIECKSVKSLVEKMEKFINLSNEEKFNMGQNGRRKMEKEFDRNIVVKAYIEEITRYIGNNELLKEPIRILQIVGGMNFGGAENILMNLYRHIDRSKVQFDFLLNRGGVFVDEIKRLGGNVYYIPALQKVGPIVYKYKLRKFFKMHPEYKIVHSHMNQVTGIILKVAKSTGVPVRIAHSHNSSNSSNIFFERVYKNYLNTKINKNATNFFACSDLAAKWLFKEKQHEAVILKNAIEIERFKFNEEKRRKIREELNISENQIVIGHVGRFNKQKNHKYLIELFNEYQKENDSSILLLVGDGNLRNTIENQIGQLDLKDKIILLGNKKNVEDYYNAMDIFLFPSLFEGLGMVLIEAQINGLKCITCKDVVPSEVDITNNVEFISLNSGINEWIDCLKKIDITRYNEIEKIIEAGYDIKTESKMLENFYLNNY